MRTQQQVERAEQQRIKSLVLNYDLSDETHTDGDSPVPFVLKPNTNGRHNRRIAPQLVGNGVQKNSAPDFNNLEAKSVQTISHQRFDKKGRTRDDRKSSSGNDDR